MICDNCKKREVEEGENLCVFCMISKRGLPWMSKMKVRHTMSAEVAYVEIDRVNYLVVSGTNGMLFTKQEVEEAEERFNGEKELIRGE
jgi:hypothetical protein